MYCFGGCGCAYIATEWPCPSSLHCVLRCILLCAQCNTEIEVAEDELDSGEKQRRERYLQRTGVWFFLLDVPTQGILPRYAHIGDLHTTRLCQAQTNVVPIMAELDTGLIRLGKGEDVIPGAFVYALENREIGDNTACVEELEPVENEAVAVGLDG